MTPRDSHNVAFGVSLSIVIVLQILWLAQLTIHTMIRRRNRYLQRIKHLARDPRHRAAKLYRVGQMQVLCVRLGVCATMWLLVKAIDPIGVRGITSAWLSDVASFNVDVFYFEIWVAVGYFLLLVVARMQRLSASSSGARVLLHFRRAFLAAFPIGHVLTFTPLLHFAGVRSGFVTVGIFLSWFVVTLLVFSVLCTIGVCRFTVTVEIVEEVLPSSSLVDDAAVAAAAAAVAVEMVPGALVTTLDVPYDLNGGGCVVPSAAVPCTNGGTSSMDEYHTTTTTRNNNSNNVGGGERRPLSLSPSSSTSALRKFTSRIIPSLSRAASLRDLDSSSSVGQTRSAYDRMITRVWRFTVCVWMVVVPVSVFVCATVVRSWSQGEEEVRHGVVDVFEAEMYALFWLQIISGYILYFYVAQPVTLLYTLIH